MDTEANFSYINKVMLERKITLADLQAPIEKILDKYPGSELGIRAGKALRRLSQRMGLNYFTVYRAARVVLSLRSKRKVPIKK